MNERKPSNLSHKAPKKKSKTFSTNPKGPIKIWVPKSEIGNAADMSKSKRRSQAMVSGQWLLKAHDKREVFVPNPNNERGRKCGIWRQPVWQDH